MQAFQRANGEYLVFHRQCARFLQRVASWHSRNSDTADQAIVVASDVEHLTGPDLIGHRIRFQHLVETFPVLAVAISRPRARVSYVAHYHDALGREIATANYGTNGDVPLVRSATIPAPSDDVLVTRMVYNEAGQLAATIDPSGRKDCFEHDAMGRQTKEIRNCLEQSSSSSSSSSGPQHYDSNVMVFLFGSLLGWTRAVSNLPEVESLQVTLP